MGPAFAIQDYLWQPLPDGGIYLGDAAHALFAGKPVSILPEFSQTQAAGNTLTLPMVPSLRPGVLVNGKPLIWQAVNPLTGKTTAKSSAQRQIDAAYPELSAGLHLPKFARVRGRAKRSAGVTWPIRSAPVTRWMFNYWMRTATRQRIRRYIRPCRSPCRWPA